MRIAVVLSLIHDGMKRLGIVSLGLWFGYFASANEGPWELWNAGAGGLVIRNERPDVQEPIRIRKELALVYLYEGFAAVRAEYLLENPAGHTVAVNLSVPDKSGIFHPEAGRLHADEVYRLRVLSNGNIIQPHPVSDSIPAYPFASQGLSNPASAWLRLQSWRQEILPGATVQVVMYYLTRNHLARLQHNQVFRDGNAFVYFFADGPAPDSVNGVRQILVKLQGDLGLNMIRGVSPDGSVNGNLKHLSYGFSKSKPAGGDQFLVWYEGAPPDFGFEKKVIPLSDTLFRLLDQFPVGEFEGGALAPVSRRNFETSGADNPLAGILYFLMFFVPWIILGAFILFLFLGKRKKKTEANERSYT